MAEEIIVDGAKIEYEPVTLNLTKTEADKDWIRSGRLREAADAGDMDAAAELEEMEDDGQTYNPDSDPDNMDVTDGDLDDA